MCGLVPYKAAALGNQLEFLLGDPEMVALLAASPRLGKTLRPLCRMLGFEVALAAMVAPVAAVASGSDEILPVEATATATGVAGSGWWGDLRVGLGAVVTVPGLEPDDDFCELA